MLARKSTARIKTWRLRRRTRFVTANLSLTAILPLPTADVLPALLLSNSWR
jgi:hypothetical protein